MGRLRSSAWVSSSVWDRFLLQWEGMVYRASLGDCAVLISEIGETYKEVLCDLVSVSLKLLQTSWQSVVGNSRVPWNQNVGPLFLQLILFYTILHFTIPHDNVPCYNVPYYAVYVVFVVPKVIQLGLIFNFLPLH